MKTKHIHGWIALLLCLQLVVWASGTVCAKEAAVDQFHVPLVEVGSASVTHGESAHPEVSEAIYKAMIGLEKTLDLSDYHVTTMEVLDCYSALLNDRYYIDLFYASDSFGASYNPQTLIVNYIQFQYTMTEQEIVQRQAFIERELEAILDGVNPAWSDLEKVLYLHDYLCLNFQYDLSLTIGDVYTFLQGKTGVCEAYYGTYRMLLEKLNIDSHSATSKEMVHVWNMIELDGTWYHVDATWGDPTPDLLGRARHYHFLLSDTGINTKAENESYHYGWVAGSRVPAEGANSTKYEGWFWNKVDSAFVPLDDEWYYIDKEYGICSVEFDESDLDMEKEHAITEKWWAVGQPGAYWPGMYTGLSRHGNELIYNTYNQVIAFDPETDTTRVVYTLETDEKLILGSAMQGDQLRIQLNTTPNDKDREIYTVEDYHNWIPADCDSPKTCAACGITEGEPLGHKWTAADCDTPKTCSACGATEGNPLGHKWTAADCDTPKTCSVCGETEGNPLGHKWTAADCVTPKNCSACGATEGIALGHKWTAADCDTPKTCSTCGATEGNALGHKWTAADCDTPKTCSVCGATEGEPLGHKWTAADCDTPKTCSACGATEGEPLGHDWDDGQVLQKPTYEEPGVMVYTCLHNSDHTYEEEIPVLIKPEYSPVTLKLTGDSVLTLQAEKAIFTLCAENMQGLTEVHLVMEYDETALTDPALEALDGWMVLCSKCENGKLLAILCSESGADGNANLLQIAWKLTGKIGSGSVAISEVHLNAGEIEVDVQTEQVRISFTVKANIYDINADGVVSLLDMTRAQRYFGEENPEADLNGDHTVDVQDLILILMNFTA